MRPGSKIYRYKGLIKHYGIYVGAGRVIHNSYDDGEVCTTTYEAFAAGQRVVVESSPTPGTEHLVVARAERLRGARYSLVFFNCESFAHLVTEGRVHSKQVAVATDVSVLALRLLHRAWNRPAYDPSVDRHRDKKGRFAKPRG